MASNRKPIKTKVHEIVQYWRDHYGELGFEPMVANEDMTEPACMVCGMYDCAPWVQQMIDSAKGRKPSRHRGPYGKWIDFKLERAHLHSACLDGPDEPSNFIMACRSCNMTMPTFADRESALKFLRDSKWAGMRQAVGQMMLNPSTAMWPTLEVFQGFFAGVLEECEKATEAAYATIKAKAAG